MATNSPSVHSTTLFSVAHFWSVVGLRFCRIILKTDKNPKLIIAFSSSGNFNKTFKFRNILWIQLPSGAKSLDKDVTDIINKPAAEDLKVVAHGFFQTQSYSIDTLHTENLTISDTEPFLCHQKKISLFRNDTIIRMRTIILKGDQLNYRILSPKVNHEAFTKIDLP